MELEGAKQAFNFLQTAGVAIKVIISGRHHGIAKWIRESQAGCSHFFDIWHVARSIGKAMLKLGKEKGCERISDWVKGAHNHLYWCAMSNKQGFEELIAAKWKSFMLHLHLPNYNFFHADSPTLAEGTAIYTKDTIKAIPRPELKLDLPLVE